MKLTVGMLMKCDCEYELYIGESMWSILSSYFDATALLFGVTFATFQILFETQNMCSDADHSKTIKIIVLYVNIKQFYFSSLITNADDWFIAFRNWS
jgi:hypothetical protein